MRLPRCRTVMKWTGAVLCVAVLATALASWWRSACLCCDTANARWLITVGCGGVSVQRGEGAEYYASGRWQYFSFPLANRAWAWMPHSYTMFVRPTGELARGIEMPLYIPFALLALPTTWLFYRDRRRVRWAREGRCVGCGYDLSGVSGKCPECGRGAVA